MPSIVWMEDAQKLEILKAYENKSLGNARCDEISKLLLSIFLLMVTQ